MLEETSFAPRLGPQKPAIFPTANPAATPVVASESITLDPVCSSDEAFLYQTYASTRAEEVALTGWSAEKQEEFLHMQYEAQSRSYLVQTPEAKYFVIRCDGIAAGRLIVERTADEIHVIDIALIPDFRRRGIGSALMRTMIQEAEQDAKAVRLFVEQFNPALRWYERLGFRVVSAGPIYFEMVWRPVQAKARAAD
jgi:ribosomal protein S18 acetylase RimI-like enzyme